MNQRDFHPVRPAIDQLSSASLAPLMIGLVSILIFAHLFVLNPDDLSMKWVETPDLAMRNLTFANYRYIPSLVHWAISAAGSSYFQTVAFWSALFAIGLYACTLQLAGYVGIGKQYAPWLFAFVSVQSYWADTYRFSLAHMHFALGLLFISGCLGALNASGMPRHLKLALASFAAYLSLITYQAFIFVLIFAPALALFSAALDRRLDGRTARSQLIDMAIVLVVGFAAAGATVKVLGFFGLSSNAAARAAGIGQAVQNLPAYLRTIVDPFLSVHFSYSKLVPAHERLLFGGSILAALAMCARLPQKKSVKLAVFAMLLASIALLPDPLNLPSPIFWPVPRSMVADSFFFVFLSFILATAAKRRWPASRTPHITLAVAGILSLANQVHALKMSFDQTAIDRHIALQVITDMRKTMPVHEGSEVGILSSWKNPAQIRENLLFEIFDSTFTDDWSKLEIIEDTLSFRVKRKTLAPADCEGHASPWEVKQIDGAIAVCMD